MKPFMHRRTRSTDSIKNVLIIRTRRGHRCRIVHIIQNNIILCYDVGVYTITYLIHTNGTTSSLYALLNRNSIRTRRDES